MTGLESKDKIIEKIIEKSGKTKKEIEKLINEKKNKFSGLLTDSGAAFMIAKDLKIDLQLENNLSEKMQISHLENEMKHVDLDVEIKTIFAKKKFERENRKGQYQNVLIKDSTGEIMLTLWNKDVEFLNEQKLEKGSKISLKNCYVNSFNGKKKVNLGNSGQILVKEKVHGKTTKISDLKEEKQSVDVLARISKIFGIKEFQTDKGTGKLFSFEIGDETGKIRVTAWEDSLLETENLKINDIVKIENAFTKKGFQNEIELNLGWRTHVLVEPETSIELPKAIDLNKEEIEKTTINELKEHSYNKEINGTIVALKTNRMFFKSKTNPEEKKIFCSFELDDGKGLIKCACFGEEAEKILGQTTQELLKKAQEKEESQLLDSIKDNVVGRQITLIGNAKHSDFSGQLEFIANKVVKIEGIASPIKKQENNSQTEKKTEIQETELEITKNVIE